MLYTAARRVGTVLARTPVVPVIRSARNLSLSTTSRVLRGGAVPSFGVQLRNAGARSFCTTTMIGQVEYDTDTAALDEFTAKYGEDATLLTPFADASKWGSDNHLYCVVNDSSNIDKFVRLNIASLEWETVKADSDFANAVNIELVTHDGPNFLITRSDGEFFMVNSSGCQFWAPGSLNSPPVDGAVTDRYGCVLQHDGTVLKLHKHPGKDWSDNGTWASQIPNANGMSSHDGVYVIATDTGLKGYNKDGGTEALPADITPPSGHNTKTMDTFTNSTGQIVVATSVTAKKMSNPHPGNPSYATALLNDTKNNNGFVQALFKPIENPIEADAALLKPAPIRVFANNEYHTYLMVSGMDASQGFLPLKPISAGG